MKTKKFFMLLAAVLLMSVSAMAQSGNSEPLNGDVNGDGTVDVADMVGVIKIMKDGGGAVGEKQAYWYAGTNGGNAVTADNFTDVATKIAESEIPQTGTVTASGQYVYIVLPETRHLESLTDEGGSAVEFTCTDVMGYHIYRTVGSINTKLNYTIEETTYYWYVGTTKPTNDAFIESNGAQISNSSEISSFTIDSDEYVYFVYPTSFGTAKIVDEGGDDAGGKAVETLSGVSLTNYKGWRFNKYNSGSTYTITFQYK